MNVKFTETVLRDANQSLVATRMPFSDFEDILETLDKAELPFAGVLGGELRLCLRYLSRIRGAAAPHQGEG